MAAPSALLAGEADPVIVVNGEGASPICLVCEHAGRKIPKSLGNLGLGPDELEAHIAWDIGAEAVSRRLSAKLDAPLVLQRYSRLVYDCNRPPDAPDAMPAVSESTRVPGNEDLGEGQRQERADLIYRPFQAAVSRLLEARLPRGDAPALVTIHSFTAVYKDVRRSVEIGILHDSDARLANAVLKRFAQSPGFVVRRNEPYGPGDGVTHTLKLQAIARGIPNVMIEIRNDLIGEEAGQRGWADRLADIIGDAVRIRAREEPGALVGA